MHFENRGLDAPSAEGKRLVYSTNSTLQYNIVQSVNSSGNVIGAPVYPSPALTQQESNSGSNTLAYVLVPLGSLVLIAVLSFLVVCILRKTKLDKLRHHLMPLYNFDPAEEEGDWESELLEEDKEQRMALQSRSLYRMTTPKLKFHSDHMEL